MKLLALKYPIVRQKTVASLRPHESSHIGFPSTKAFPLLQVSPTTQTFPTQKHFSALLQISPDPAFTKGLSPHTATYFRLINISWYVNSEVIILVIFLSLYFLFYLSKIKYLYWNQCDVPVLQLFLGNLQIIAI